MKFMFEPFSKSLNKNINTNSDSNGKNTSKEYLQLKKEYENLKENYNDLIKSLEQNKELKISKVKKYQDLVDKLNLYSKELIEYKNVIKNTIKKIEENINTNIISNYYKDKPDLRNKLESVILFVMDNINSKNEKIKDLNDEKQILLNNIKTNNLKKNLFDFLNAKTEINNEENNKIDLINKIKKIREGYQTKNIENKTQVRDIPLNYELLSNKENNNILNFSQVYKRK